MISRKKSVKRGLILDSTAHGKNGVSLRIVRCAWFTTEIRVQSLGLKKHFRRKTFVRVICDEERNSGAVLHPKKVFKARKEGGREWYGTYPTVMSWHTTPLMFIRPVK